MTQEQINNIRRLLQRFYQGETKPEEEFLLADMLRDADKLPEDMEADRRLFASLYQELPTETQERIERALEIEMARERKAFSSHRKRWNIAAVAAASIAIFALGINLLVDKGPDLNDKQMQNAYSQIPTDNSKIASSTLPPSDSLIMTPIAQNVENPASPKISKSEEEKKGQSSVQLKKDDNKEKVENHGSMTDRRRTDYEEYIASNYRVIDDPVEAQYLVSELFASIENNILIERSRVADVYDNIQFELTNCCVQMQ